MVIEFVPMMMYKGDKISQDRLERPQCLLSETKAGRKRDRVEWTPWLRQ